VVTPDPAYDELLGLAGVELSRLIRRTGQLSGRAWSTRRAPVVALLGQLAELDAELEQTGPHELPDLPDHALSDALAVLGSDALEALVNTPDPVGLDRVVAGLRAAWSATR
jgi:hypothetical protein